MRSPGGGVLRMALPVRAMLQRLGFALLIATAFALMLLGRLDNAIVEQTRLAIVDAVAPIMEVVSRPAAAFNRMVDGINEQIHLRRELARLQEETLRLRQWQTVAR
ncbi:MAG: rod shape-determining protein MreC, partial [Proteobacteria bacterium]|nr:rod shape-determining protein MreC [Pseudomonadota bacterium]